MGPNPNLNRPRTRNLETRKHELVEPAIASDSVRGTCSGKMGLEPEMSKFVGWIRVSSFRTGKPEIVWYFQLV